MLAHIIRENYAEETAQRKFSPIPPASPYKCASLAMDRHCLGNIMDKVIGHLADNHTIRGCPACFLILKGVVISSHETNRFS